jgi:hypothetical protein
MGRIREYQSQSEIQGPVAAPGRKADPSSSSGKGLEDLGRGLETLGDALYKRQARDETTAVKVQATTAYDDLSNSFKSKLSQLGPGTDPNSDEYKNLMSDYDNEINDAYSKIGQNLETGDAKDYFQETFASHRSSLLKDAFHEKAQTVAESTAVAFQGSLDKDSASLIDNPSDFHQRRSDQVNWVHKQVQIGAIDPVAGAKLTEKIDGQLGAAAMTGLVRQSPDSAEKSLKSGAWDGILDGSQKEHFYNQIEVERRAKDAQVKDLQRKQDDAKAEKQDQNFNSLLEGIISKQVTPLDVARADIPNSNKLTLIHEIDKRSKATTNDFDQTNPERMKDVFDRVVALPDGDPNKITDQSALLEEYRKGGISTSDFKRLRDELAKGKTDQGKLENKMKSAALTMGKQTIFGGGTLKDPEAPAHYLGFQQAYWDAYANGIKAGKSPHELTSPDFVQQVLRPFVRTPQQKLQSKVSQQKQFQQKLPGNAPQDKMKYMNDILKKKGLFGG